VAGKLLNVAQRATRRNDILGAAGDERAASGVAGCAGKTEGRIQAVKRTATSDMPMSREFHTR